jgi:hypothetical protein
MAKAEAKAEAKADAALKKKMASQVRPAATALVSNDRLSMERNRSL